MWAGPTQINEPNPTQLELGRVDGPNISPKQGWADLGPTKISHWTGYTRSGPKIQQSWAGNPAQRKKTHWGKGIIFPSPTSCMQNDSACRRKTNIMANENSGGEEYLARRRRCCWSNVHVDGAAAEVGGSKRRFPTVR